MCLQDLVGNVSILLGLGGGRGVDCAARAVLGAPPHAPPPPQALRSFTKQKGDKYVDSGDQQGRPVTGPPGDPRAQ